MARSPAHRFGQLIGDALQVAVIPLLEDFAARHDLYLDKQGNRPCRRGKKCSWIDLGGNSHDLDFVLERGGTPEKIGTPVAFIESAWRRYTKHSRNKVQEIQGALQPLADTYRNASPFKGAILAGVFTSGALAQLKSLGFNVVYLSYDSVVEVFRRFGIDASFNEATSIAEFRRKILAQKRLTPKKRTQLQAELLRECQAEIGIFMQALEVVVSRQIERITVLALHGQMRDLRTIEEAVRFIQAYSDDGRTKPIDHYQVEVRYNNGDTIRGKFGDKSGAIAFLDSYRPVVPHGN